MSSRAAGSGRMVLPERSARFYRLTGRELGQGAYGSVYLVEKLTEPHKGQPFAVKRIKLVDPEVGIDISTMGEISLLSRLDHPNVLHIEDVDYDASAHVVYEYLEYAPGGNLKDYLGKWFEPGMRARKANDIVERIQILYGMLCGLGYLHANGIWHLDLKPDNLLFDAAGVAKIADFGLSERKQGEREDGTTKVTWTYRSPEMFCATGEYDASADIWSIGVIACQIFFDNLPFFDSSAQRGYDEKDLLTNIKHKVGYPSKKLLYKFNQSAPRTCSTSAEEIATLAGTQADMNATIVGDDNSIGFYKEYYTEPVYQQIFDLIRQCLTFDKDVRATASNLKKHALFDTNVFCKSCRCEEEVVYQMPPNDDISLQPSVTIFIDTLDLPHYVVQYTREIVKRLNASNYVVKDAPRLVHFACLSIALKMLMQQDDKFYSLFVKLLVYAYQSKDSNPPQEVIEALGEDFGVIELGICRALEWNFDGPPKQFVKWSSMSIMQLRSELEARGIDIVGHPPKKWYLEQLHNLS